ncbi:MAG: hypothetical protein QOE59_772 [Actinomycetota bacterium]|jgi:hypothetical protein|nr:hypothetical protein [Actinomycetota bacterium]
MPPVAPLAPGVLPRPVALAAAALPPLLLAALGSTHPTMLTPASAPWWRDLHVIGLVLFPLLALGPWVVVRGRSRLIEVAVVVLGLLYACCYTALDVLAGIGAGQETVVVGPGPWVPALFGMADRLAVPGVYAYLATAVIGGATAVVVAHGLAARAAAVVGTVLVVGGAWSFLTSHIYPPVGVATMVVLAAGWTILAAAVPPAVRSRRPRSPRRPQPAPT